jgi:DNA-binding response OmpR family regulator
MPSPEQPGSEVRRILVVEDDALVCETIAAMLEDDYQAVMAGTVDSALALLGGVTGPESRDKPDLILLDCLLPGGGLSHVLRAADLHSIPVVLTSGDPERAAWLDAGRPFLAKPFSQAKLLQVLRATHG